MIDDRRSKVILLIENAEATYKASFALLISLKNQQEIEGSITLLEFQKVLADLLFRQESMIVDFSQEINKKKPLVDDELQAMRAILRESVEIGKSIGDAFVWLFYLRDLSLLERHQLVPDHGPSPGGLGIQGELAFLKKFQIDGPYFYLYHGNTNQFRLGDFSVYDVRRGHIVAIVELKTIDYQNKQMQQEINCVLTTETDASRDFVRFMNERPQGSFPESTKVPSASALARKERQLEKIENAFLSIQNGTHLRINIDGTADTFRRLEASLISSRGLNFFCSTITNYLGVAVFWIPADTLYETLVYRTTQNPEFKSEELIETAKAVTNPAWENELRISSAFYDKERPIVLPGHKPFFWCFRDENLATEVLMKKVSITNLFNPGALLKALKDAGWEQKEDKKVFFRKEERANVEIGNLDMFFHLANWYYYDISVLLQQIETSISKAREKATEGVSVRAEMHFRQL